MDQKIQKTSRIYKKIVLIFFEPLELELLEELLLSLFSTFLVLFFLSTGGTTTVSSNSLTAVSPLSRANNTIFL